MKQNEKVLVYAVTGFLLVILGIAILFGKDGPRRPGAPAAPEPKPAARQPATGGANGIAELWAALQNNGEAGKPPAPAQTGIAPPDQQPLLATPPPTPAEQVLKKFGDSRHVRDFRIVKAMPGDSLGLLVQRWCGNASAETMQRVQSLNEGLRVLRPNDDVVLPWVDDEQLLAAAAPPPVAEAPGNGTAVPAAAEPHANAAVPAIGTPPSAPVAPAPATRLYKLQQGDKLWSIAVREVGMKAAPAYLEQVRQLNPQIPSLDSVRAGQELRLPAKG